MQGKANPIQRHRIAAGLTQEQLVREAGISLSTLQKLETGATPINRAKIGTLSAIARTLNISVDDLINQR